MRYIVPVIRISTGYRLIEVEANNTAEAREVALDEAGNYEFPEDESDYHIDETEITEGELD